MDVHYLPSQYRASRPIKDYFIEFILIFLAVMLGLYVNHYLESKTEKVKTKDFARTIYDDLKIDVTNLQRTIDEKNWIGAKYDSLEDILATKDVREHNEYIYYVERYVAKSPVFESKDITYDQLRNPANKKDTKDIKLQKNIAAYNASYKQYRAKENTFINFELSNLSEIESSLFNPSDLSSLDNPKSDDFQALVLRPGVELQPIRRNTTFLKLLYIKVDYAGKHTRSMRLLLEKQKALGLSLMKELEKEYNLE